MASAEQITSGSAAPRTVLAVDDDPGVLRLIEKRLRQEGYRTVGLGTGRAGTEWLAVNRADLVLVDFKLPDMLASEFVDALAARGIEFPFVVITGMGDERVAVDMMKRGARDYLRKDTTLFDVLPAVVARTLEQIERERRVAGAEEAFRLLHTAVDQAKDAVLITTADIDAPGPTVVFANPAFYALTGYREHEVIGRSPRLLQGSATDRTTVSRMRRALEQAEPWSGQLVNYRKDGTHYDIELNISPIRDANGTVTHFVAIERDISERTRLEQQLRQATKMEAVGSLAGGIAHDFNNMLAVIRGHSELLLEHLHPGQQAHESVDAIKSAAEHASSLTRQLLSFSRRSVLQPELVKLGEVVDRSVRLLRRLLGENITIEVRTDPGLVKVAADPNQMEQVVLNLAINARDAMPAGGTLSFQLDNFVLDEPGTGYYFGMTAGTYAVLAVEDSGTGMDPETLSHIFEPFFTTKPHGEGTGLGLATVYGIVRQSGGQIRVHSQVGRGTRFEVFLPQAIVRVERELPALHDPVALSGHETVLVAEDDPMVRRLLVRCLSEAGYRVLEAKDGDEALAVIESSGASPDALVTDVMMPNRGGPELAARLRETEPGLPVLFLSGYTDRAFDRFPLDENSEFMPKPFTPRVLLERLRAMFDRS